MRTLLKYPVWFAMHDWVQTFVWSVICCSLLVVSVLSGDYGVDVSIKFIAIAFAEVLPIVFLLRLFHFSFMYRNIKASSRAEFADKYKKFRKEVRVKNF